MLEQLRFVQGAVAKKDLVPELTHFNIHAGRVIGYNGRMALSCPIDLDFDAMPAAVPFVTAISKCTEEVALGLTQTKRLSIRSGSFKAFVDCATGVYPDIKPSGTPVAVAPDFLDALATIYPFTSEDASRVWSQGILFRGSSAFATNNVVLVERWLGTPVSQPINIPKTTVAELLRIKETPTHMQVDEKSVTFFFEGDRWLWSLLYETSWPDLERVLNLPPTAMQPLPENFFPAVRDVAAFAAKEGYVWFHESTVRSRPVGVEEGAVFDLGCLLPTGVYNATQLLKLEGVAQTFDYAAHPQPALFYGDKMRGAIIGVRL